MMDPSDILKARKAKLLAEAQRRADALVAEARRKADALDRGAPELERALALLAEYDLEVVEKNALRTAAERANGRLTEEEIVVDPNLPSYRAAISVCEQAIKAAKQPLELSVLYDACLNAGVRLGGKRPQSTLSAFLSDDKSTVESISKGMYWLRGVTRPH
jgi:hypothetical protein